MRVLIINKFLYPNGGSETYIFKLGEALEQHGHEVQYFGMEHEGRCVGNRVNAYTSDMDFHGGSKLSKLTYPIKTIYSKEAREKLRLVLDDFKPDVCHLNNFNYQLTPSIILEIVKWRKETGRDCKIIFTAHDYQLVCPNHQLKNPITHENCEKCLGGHFMNCVKGKCVHGSTAKSIVGMMEAEGHIGTWYAIDETEIGGEKFFLLEHEEHGDMAACVAVNERGKLVAEDLWNGFDEDFQEAVQKYLSEKWNMPKKENVVAEIIEKAAPVPDNSAQDYSDVPVYYEPFSYAKENDEVDLYRTSYRLNSECKQAIHEAIADNYDGMYLGDGAVDQVVRQYGMERVGYILANTLHHKSYDGRFSPGNKEWAEQVSTPEHNADRMTFRTDWVVDSHPAILDGFVTMFRKELEAQKEQEQPFVKQFYVVENMQAAPLKIERFGNLDDAMSQYQALPNHYMKALGVEKNPDPLPGSLDILQCRNGIDTIVEDYKTVPGWDNPYIQNHVVQPLQGALAVQDVELAYELPDAYFHIQTCEDGFDYTLYNKDFTERDGGILETDGDKPVQEAMTELLAEFGCDAAEGKVMDAAELREQADTVAEQQAGVLKEKLAAERPAPEETLSFYVAECLEFTFAGEFHDHLTMEEALEAYDKIPSERMNADKCIGFCIEEDGGFVGMYELVVNDKVQRENINSINYFRDDKLVQQAISDMEKLMAARQQSKEQERGSTKKSVLDALRSLKAKKQEQPAQEQDKPKKAKKKGMEL